jgi:hypothetical protein
MRKSYRCLIISVRDIKHEPCAYPFAFVVSEFEIIIEHQPNHPLIRDQLDRGARILGLSGVRVQMRCSGKKTIVTMVRPSGVPVRDDERLTVVTTDFLATSGDGVFSSVVPPKGFELPEEGPIVRDVVAAWLERRGGRLRDAQLVDNKRPRWPSPVIRCGG